VRLQLRAAYRSIQLDFAPHTRETFADEIKQAEAMKKYDSKYRIRRANAMLVTHDQHRPIRQLSYPVQAIRLGHDFTILVLAGEVVVDYQLRAKREFPKTNLMVIGYANDVLSYIPSRRVLREGGYEVVESMIYYGLPGPYAESVEEKIFRAIRHVVHDVAE
jgi:hypothetical protein